MPEKKRSGQAALLIAAAFLLVVIFTLVFQSGSPEPRVSTELPAKEPIPAQTVDRSGPSPKKQVEEKLAQALAAKPSKTPERNKVYQPPRSPRPRPNERGGFDPVTHSAEGDPVDLVLDFLESSEPGKPLDQGWNESDFVQPILTNRIRSRHNGVTHLYLRQNVGGIEVYNGNLNANILKDGSILSLHNGFVKDVAARINRRDPVLSAREAIAAAAEQVQAGVDVDAGALTLETAPAGPAQSAVFNGGTISQDPIPAKLVYVAQSETETRLAWNLVMHLKDGVRWLDLTVDAETGKLLTRANWYANADYNVFALPKETPNDGPRTLETDPHDPASSPFGWHDTNGAAGAEFTTTQGNNVSAQEDTDANNVGGRRPEGTSALVFDNPLNLGLAPDTYEEAAVTNLFYWNNVIHDILWHYGFDEASGNFQENNYSNGGVAGDPVQADAQDGSFINNANFGTPPDGQDPRMQMFIWNFTTPNRDSDLDNGIIIHEYGHGISNRLTGGPANASALTQSQAIGMGEGWSDWWALCLTAVPSDTPTTPRGIGTYVFGEPVTGPGIRPYRYTTDMVENPQTYGDLDDGGLSVPHGIGSVWCTTLWEVYWELVAEHGWDPNFATGSGGNNIAMQLVIDGMKLQPADPTYLEARDAIVLADQVNNGGENFDRIWVAFAKRGMGFSADDGGSASSLNVTEAFDVPNEAISVTDVSVFEGNSGTVQADFTVSLDMASPDEEIRVDWVTANGTAIEPGDYAADSGQLIFPAGTTQQTVSVMVNGDPDTEDDETFFVRLSNPVDAFIADDEGVGTILNDDYITPLINSPLTANGSEGIPFFYTITGANTPRTFSIGGSVPGGMTVDGATGVISWTSPVIGNYTIDITVANPAGSDTESLAITIVENPLLTALDVSGVSVSTGAAPWFRQSVVTHDGVDAAESADIEDNQNSWLELEITGPDTIFFYWKVSSELGWDFLNLSLDGAVSQSISGEVDWQLVELNIPSGNHTVRWDYVKDFSISDGSDAAWVDEVVLVSQDPRPFITGNLKISGEKDVAFSYQIQTSKPATTYAAIGLPPGLVLNTTSGEIFGLPLEGGVFDVALRTENAAGFDTKTLEIFIEEVVELPFFDDFESGRIGPGWKLTGTNEFRTEVTDQFGPPRSGTYHLVMDDLLNGSFYSRNETTLSINLAGQTNLALGFWARDFQDEPHGPPPSPFTNGADFDGVAISEDGVSWYEVQGLRDEISDEWTYFQIDLDAAITEHGLSYTSRFQIRFNQYDNFEAAIDGIGIDDVSVGRLTETPDLTDATDSGASNADDLTNDATPDFTGGNATPGSTITLESDIDGIVGTGTTNASGLWAVTATASLSDGKHEITATESGGVASPPLEVTIDTIGATVTVNQAAGQEDPTMLPMANFRVSFDDPAQSFGSGNVEVAGTAAAGTGKTVTENSPNDGTSFNVAVTGIQGDGFVQVTVTPGATTDLAGNPSQPSSSADNVVFFLEPAAIPTGVAASDSSFTDKIQVTWNQANNADGGYRIYRNTSDSFAGASLVGATLESNRTFNDTLAVAGTPYFYWVKASRQHSELSAESASDSGIRAVDGHGNTPGTATDLGTFAAGMSTEAGILESQDKDYFRFELPWKAHAKIYSTESLDTVGTLLESDGVTVVNDVAADKDARPDGRNFEIEEVLEAGVYFINVTGEGNNQSGAYEVVFEIEGPLNFQPDRHIGANPTALRGDDFYSDTGSGQSQTLTSKKLRATVFHGRVENDGNFADEFTMRGKRGTSQFKITYFDESGNVTAAMVAGTLLKAFAAGEGETIRVVVKPSRRLKNKRTKRIKRKQIVAQDTVTSGQEGTQKDAVKAITKTK